MELVSVYFGLLWVLIVWLGLLVYCLLYVKRCLTILCYLGFGLVVGLFDRLLFGCCLCLLFVLVWCFMILCFMV